MRLEWAESRTELPFNSEVKRSSLGGRLLKNKNIDKNKNDHGRCGNRSGKSTNMGVLHEVARRGDPGAVEYLKRELVADNQLAQIDDVDQVSNPHQWEKTLEHMGLLLKCARSAKNICPTALCT